MSWDPDSWVHAALNVDVGSIVSEAKSAASSAVDTVSNVASAAVDDVKSTVETTVAAATQTVASTVSAVETEVTADVKKAAATGAKVVSTVASAQAKAAAAAGSAVEDVASDAWKGAKVVGGAIEDEAKSKYQEMKDDAKLVKEGEGYVDKGIDWLEDEAKSGTKWAADQAKGIPVVEQVAQGAEKAVDTYVDFEGGVLKGATGLVGGVVGVVADPVDTAKALYTMSEHIPVLGLPEKVLGEAYDVATSDKTLEQAAKEVADPMDDAKYWGNVGKGLWDPISKSFAAGKPAEGIGQIGVQVASLFVGAGEVGAAGEVAEVAGTAGKVADLGDAAELGKAADVAKGADAADAAKVADVSKGADMADAGNASKATDAADAAADAKRVQVPKDPNVNPYAPTEPPPPNPHAPTQLPPDYLENPTFPPDPKVPTFPEPVPVSGSPLKGMDIKTLGTPTGDLAGLTEGEIDTFLDGMEGNAKSDTFLEMPGQNPETGAGLQDINEVIKPNGINYNVNHYLSDVGKPRIADMADVPIAGTPGESLIPPGESLIPKRVGTTGGAVPETTLKTPGGDGLLNEGGEPIGTGNVEVRYHSTNPKFPDNGPTVQVNTPSNKFGWAGDEDVTVEGAQDRRLLPDGTWKTMKQMTEEEAKNSHWPTGN